MAKKKEKPEAVPVNEPKTASVNAPKTASGNEPKTASGNEPKTASGSAPDTAKAETAAADANAGDGKVFTMTADEMAKVKAHIEELTRSKDEMVALAQRTQADFDNFRRRNQSVYADALETGSRDIIKELLPVVDDLERALGNAGDGGSAFVDGMKLIEKKLLGILAKGGLKEIDASSRFDPNLHEAVMQGEADGKVAGDIIDVFQKGYTVNDRVIRHSMVKVAK